MSLRRLSLSLSVALLLSPGTVLADAPDKAPAAPAPKELAPPKESPMKARETPPEAPAPDKASQGTRGKVTGKRVNIRLKPDTSSMILVTAQEGTEVEIVGHEPGWYKVRFPKSSGLWMSSHLVTVQGETAEVTQDESPLLEDSRLNAPVVAKVAQGTKLPIRARKEGWVKVGPPPAVVAYVSEKYVDVPGMAPAGPAAGGPMPAGPATPLGRKMDALVQGGYTEKELAEAEAEARKQLAAAKTPQEKQEAQETLQTLQHVRQVLGKVAAADRKRDEELARIRREYEIKLQQLQQPRKPVWDAEGWVSGYGPVFGRPSAYVLEHIKGERTWFLTSDDSGIDLRQYLFKRVGVKGTVEGLDEGWKAQGLIRATKIEDLSPESAAEEEETAEPASAPAP